MKNQLKSVKQQDKQNRRDCGFDPALLDQLMEGYDPSRPEELEGWIIKWLKESFNTKSIRR